MIKIITKFLTQMNCTEAELDASGASSTPGANVEISTSDAQLIAAKLRNNTTLERFVIHNAVFSPEGVQCIADALAENSTLTELDFSCTYIGHSGVQALARALEKNSTLKVLDLSTCGIADSDDSNVADIQAIANMLQKNTSLKEFHFAENYIGDERVRLLAEALQNNHSLETLELTGSSISSTGAKALAELIAKNTPLTSLDLIDNDIGDEAALLIARALESNTNLTYLDLRLNNSLGERGSNAIASAMATRLTQDITQTLTLHMPLYKQGVEALAKSLENNTSLTTLNLADGRIGDEAALYIANALERNKTLTRLDLTNNEIEENGAQALIKALEKNFTLTTFRFIGNSNGNDEEEDDDDEIEEPPDIAKFIMRNRKLQTLLEQSKDHGWDNLLVAVCGYEWGKKHSLFFVNAFGIRVFYLLLKFLAHNQPAAIPFSFFSLPELNIPSPVLFEHHENIFPPQPTIPGLIYTPVPGDGHCLYRSVMYSLNESVESLRHAVADYLAHNLENYRCYEATLPDGCTLEDYVEKIRETNTWGGDLEISILMQLLNRPIVVIGPDENIVNPSGLENFSGEPIFIYHNGKNHYSALPLDGTREGREILAHLIRPDESSAATTASDMSLTGNDATPTNSGP